VKLGLFGGSFDPIHEGHLEPVRAARQELGLDRVLYLPTAQPPHKPDRRFASAWARYAMVELALLEEEGLFASAFELTPARTAYTVETLRHFRQELPAAELTLLIGTDSYRDLPTWYRWEEVLQLASLAVVIRPGVEIDPTAPTAREEPAALEFARHNGRVRYVANRPVPFSSTQVRAALVERSAAAEGFLTAALHPRVLQYIRKYDLYR
jgi:nicotinate-nucleotide adenylyltransferase